MNSEINLKHMHCWKTKTYAGTEWFHAAWWHPTGNVISHSIREVYEWCHNTYGESGYAGVWINNIEHSEVSFLNESHRTMFVLRWA